MIGIWNKITYYGINDSIPESLSSRVRITNQVAASISVLSFSYSFLFMYLGYLSMGVLLATVITCGFLSPLVFNYWGWYQLSRNGFLLTFNSAVFLYAWYFSTASGIHYVFYALACFPWVFFSLKERLNLIIFTGLSIALFFVCELQVLTPPIPVNVAAMAILKPAIMGVSFVILIIIIYYFLSQTSAKEQKLEEQNKSLEDTRDDLRESLLQEEEVRKETQLMERFSDILRRFTSDSSLLSKEVLKELLDTLGIPMGAIFLLQNEHLVPVAATAYSKKPKEINPMAANSGMIGEVVRSQKSKILKDIPDNYLSIKSVVGHTAPKAIAMIPIPFEKQVIGVIELAHFQAFSPAQISFLERLSIALGIALNNTMISAKNMELLEDLGNRNQELDKQRDELLQLRNTIEERFRIQAEGQEGLIKRTLKRHEQEMERLKSTLAEKETEIQNLRG